MSVSVGAGIDAARPVRAGEELDVGKLSAFLEAHLVGGLGGALEITQFPAGHSNLTYLLRAGEREYVLRRPPFGSKVKSAHDMGREVKLLAPLSAVYPKAPKPLVYCDDESVLGAPFYVMERLRGRILRHAAPKDVDFSAPVARALGGADRRAGRAARARLARRGARRARQARGLRRETGERLDEALARRDDGRRAGAGARR